MNSLLTSVFLEPVFFQPPDWSRNTVPTIKSVRFFIGFLDVLGPQISKKPIKKRNDLVVGTVVILKCGILQIVQHFLLIIMIYFLSKIFGRKNLKNHLA